MGLGCSSVFQRYWRLGIWGESIVQWLPGFVLGLALSSWAWHYEAWHSRDPQGRAQCRNCMRTQRSVPRDLWGRTYLSREADVQLDVILPVVLELLGKVCSDAPLCVGVEQLVWLTGRC